MYTNEGLVKHAKMALALKTKYMWGGILRPITADYVNMLSGIYGAAQYSASRIAALKKLANRGYYGVDCVGLIKSYYWSGKPNGGTDSPRYGASGYPDVNANAMFAAAKVKGAIGTMPEIPGLVVYCKSHPHVGVYIGNGKVIESTLSSKGDGVIETNLRDWIWEYWFQCPYIQYPEQTVMQTCTGLKVGDKVKVKQGAPAYNGVKLASFVYGQTYDVMEIKGDRVVIGQKRKVTAAVKTSNLYKI